MQNAIVWFRAGLGMQALLAGLAIVLALIYRRKDNRGRVLLLARLLSWGMAAVMIVNVVMIAGLLLTMRQLFPAVRGKFGCDRLDGRLGNGSVIGFRVLLPAAAADGSQRRQIAGPR